MDCRQLRLQKGAKDRTFRAELGYKKIEEKGGRKAVFRNRNGRVSATDRSICIGCGLCVYHCPTKCIVLEPRKVMKDVPKDMAELGSWMTKAAEQG